MCPYLEEGGRRRLGGFQAQSHWQPVGMKNFTFNTVTTICKPDRVASSDVCPSLFGHPTSLCLNTACQEVQHGHTWERAGWGKTWRWAGRQGGDWAHLLQASQALSLPNTPLSLHSPPPHTQEEQHGDRLEEGRKRDSMVKRRQAHTLLFDCHVAAGRRRMTGGRQGQGRVSAHTHFSFSSAALCLCLCLLSISPHNPPLEQLETCHACLPWHQGSARRGLGSVVVGASVNMSYKQLRGNNGRDFQTATCHLPPPNCLGWELGQLPGLGLWLRAWWGKGLELAVAPHLGMLA